MGAPHELHAIHKIDWKRLYSVDPAAVRREIEAIWEWHVVDKDTGEINRHRDGERGCDFSMSAGAFVEAFAFLYAILTRKRGSTGRGWWPITTGIAVTRKLIYSRTPQCRHGTFRWQ